MGQMKNIVIDKEALDELRKAADKHWQENPPMIGEVFDDGQFRGGLSRDFIPPPTSIQIGDYVLWDSGENFYIVFVPTGQMGTFKKEHFESHVAAFFGLHF